MLHEEEGVQNEASLRLVLLTKPAAPAKFQEMKGLILYLRI